MKKILTILSILATVSCTKTIEKQVDNPIINNILIQKMPEDITTFDNWRQNDSINTAMIFLERLFKNEKTKDIDLNRIDLLNNCDCMIDSNRLLINISNNGGWSYRELKLYIRDTTLAAKHIFASDIEYYARTPQYIKLELSNLKPKINEVIFGKIISIFDTTFNQTINSSDTGLVILKSTEKYLGHFKCKVSKPKEGRPWYLNLCGF